MAEFRRQSKISTEDWASFGEDLRMLVEKAYPTLQAEAQELLALNRFLDEIKDPQLVFGVRQRAPANLDQAVAVTPELDTYLIKAPMVVANLKSTYDVDNGVAATVTKPTLESSLHKLIKKIDQLEWKLSAANDENFRYGRNLLPPGGTLCQKLQGGPGKWKTLGAVNRATKGTRQGAQNNGNPVAISNSKNSLNTALTLVEFRISASSCSLEVQVNNVVNSCLIDTGAAISLISRGLWEKLEQANTGLKLRQTSRELVGVQGSPVKLLGECCLEVAFVGLDRKISTPV